MGSGEDDSKTDSRMKTIAKMMLCCLLGIAPSHLYANEGYGRRVEFNEGWSFCLGNSPLAVQQDFDDSEWRRLTLPHDWAIEGDFSEDNPSGYTGGALPGGIGWYRKTFELAKKDRDKRIYIDFDGVYMNSTVYLNGHELGFRPYGYISFSYDLTPYLHWDKPNVIAVKVDNEKQPNARWFSGCGIYRNVWLRKLNPVHVAQWGTYVTTSEVSEKSARVKVVTTLQNEEEAVDTKLITQLLDSRGKVLMQTDRNLRLQAASTQDVTSELSVTSPTLWNIDNPYLYTIKSIVRTGNKVVDVYETPIGIRHFEFSPEKGFILNGKRTQINGVCLHHDLGSLGAAFNTRAMEYRLELLKAMGCNGIRCSHNPPAPELLDLCDRMGFIVMDEAFDQWYKKKTKYDYAMYFQQWHERDLTDLIMRDRNHPSIFIWSIGNEVVEQWENRNTDNLSPEEVNFILNFSEQNNQTVSKDSLPFHSQLTRRLADIVKQIDPTRPITAGCNYPDPNNLVIFSGALDVIGYNYSVHAYDKVRRHYPDKPFIVTESVSGLATRGYYRMPSDSVFIWPGQDRYGNTYIDPSYSCSAYDNCRVPWGCTQEDMLRAIKGKDFISGQYIWTGIDYIGEPTPYPWPARSSYFGLIDLACFPKDAYYLYQSEWNTEKEVLHLFPHWNWAEGQVVDMWAYYNNADEVELYLNGRSLGIRRKGEQDFHVSWRVKYEPGTIKAVSRKNGKVVAEQEIRTAGEPARIRLTPDRNVIQCDGKDLTYITVEVLDKDGNLCPNADNDITFNIDGAGFIAGVDNGSPTSMERFKANHRKAFYGKCMLVVQNLGRKGKIRVQATSPGLQNGHSTVSVK